jgi:malate permease and related proteins
MLFLQIVWDVITPIFLMMGVGFLVQRQLGFDIKSLTRLNFWVFVPSFLFVRIVESKLSNQALFSIAIHFSILFSTMFGLTWWLATLTGAGDRLRRAMTASVLFYNSGNYGVPVAQLAFGGAGLSVQAVMVMLQNFTNFTIGLGLHAGGHEGASRRETLSAIFKLPMIYTFIGACIWRAGGLPLASPLGSALHFLADGLVPIALVTLGAQMATLESHRFSREMALTLFLRLLLAPLIGFAIVWFMGIRGVLAQALVVSTSFPTAVNSALLAMEFNNEPEYAAAIVFYSTVFSMITVPLVIFVVKQLPW